MRKGKSNLSSMFLTYCKTSVSEYKWKLSSFFQFEEENSSNEFEKTLLQSNLVFIYTQIISNFSICISKHIQCFICLMSNHKIWVPLKQAFRIWKKVQHIKYWIKVILSEWTFTKLNINEFFPTFFCKQSERAMK